MRKSIPVLMIANLVELALLKLSCLQVLSVLELMGMKRFMSVTLKIGIEFDVEHRLHAGAAHDYVHGHTNVHAQGASVGGV